MIVRTTLFKECARLSATTPTVVMPRKSPFSRDHVLPADPESSVAVPCPGYTFDFHHEVRFTAGMVQLDTPDFRTVPPGKSAGRLRRFCRARAEGQPRTFDLLGSPEMLHKGRNSEIDEQKEKASGNYGESCRYRKLQRGDIPLENRRYDKNRYHCGAQMKSFDSEFTQRIHTPSIPRPKKGLSKTQTGRTGNNYGEQLECSMDHYRRREIGQKVLLRENRGNASNDQPVVYQYCQSTNAVQGAERKGKKGHFDIVCHNVTAHPVLDSGLIYGKRFSFCDVVESHIDISIPDNCIPGIVIEHGQAIPRENGKGKNKGGYREEPGKPTNQLWYSDREELRDSRKIAFGTGINQNHRPDDQCVQILDQGITGKQGLCKREIGKGSPIVFHKSGESRFFAGGLTRLAIGLNRVFQRYPG